MRNLHIGFAYTIFHTLATLGAMGCGISWENEFSIRERVALISVDMLTLPILPFSWLGFKGPMPVVGIALLLLNALIWGLLATGIAAWFGSSPNQRLQLTDDARDGQ